MSTIAEPTITCPKCRVEIRLTESLAAPLIEATRLQFEEKLAKKDQEIAVREDSIRSKEKAIQDEKRAIEDKVAEQVAAQVSTERARIAEEERRKAKNASATELEAKARELTDLQELVKERDQKLAAAQKEQAELLRKQRELDDARRELELTVEKRVQDSTATIRDQALKEAEESFLLKAREKDQTIARMQQSLDDMKLKNERIAVYIFAQIDAILTGTERVEAKHLIEVYERYFKLTHPSTNAFKSGVEADLRRFEGLFPKAYTDLLRTNPEDNRIARIQSNLSNQKKAQACAAKSCASQAPMPGAKGQETAAKVSFDPDEIRAEDRLPGETE